MEAIGIEKLTKEEYFSLEAEKAFMGRSQFKGFLDCEAKQMAVLKGDWEDEDKEALLVGSYIHAWNEGTLDKFISDHPEIFTKQGKLRAGFEKANSMIQVLEKDEFAMFALEGEKEVLFTAEFAGVPWKIMVDSHKPGLSNTDLKSCRSIVEKVWDEESRTKLSFIEAYKYILQGAIYSEVERIASGRKDWLEFILVAVSKEDPPDKEIISLKDDARYGYELNEIKLHMPHVMDVKNEVVKPRRCGVCNYCRATKKLKKIIHYTDLD